MSIVDPVVRVNILFTENLYKTALKSQMKIIGDKRTVIYIVVIIHFLLVITRASLLLLNS